MTLGLLLIVTTALPTITYTLSINNPVPQINLNKYRSKYCIYCCFQTLCLKFALFYYFVNSTASIVQSLLDVFTKQVVLLIPLCQLPSGYNAQLAEGHVDQMFLFRVVMVLVTSGSRGRRESTSISETKGSESLVSVPSVQQKPAKMNNSVD